MEQLPAGYFGELARQLAFFSAVLGGFAATFFGTLLAVNSPKRVAGWATALAAVAASSLICATLLATFTSLATHPEAPSRVAALSQSSGSRLALSLLLTIGLYSLLGSLGSGGWVRSREVGVATTVAAAVGALIATWTLVF